jgi:tetratricopeptide (TPR) repeat protein
MTNTKSARAQGVVADDMPIDVPKERQGAQLVAVPSFLRFFAATALGGIVGLGIWAFLLPRDAPPDKTPAEEVLAPAESVANKPGPDLPDEIRTAPIPDAIIAADEMLLVSDFKSARAAYEQLKLRATGDEANLIAYRIGIVAELLGEFEEARRAYQSLVDDSFGTSITKAAQLGQARIAIAKGRFREAQMRLAKELLASGGARQHGDFLLAESAHLLAQCQARELLFVSQQDLLDDHAVVVPSLPLQAAELLRLAETRSTPEDEPANAVEQRIAIVHRFGPEPEQTQVAVNMTQISLPEAITALARDTGLRVVASEMAKRSTIGRSTTIRQENTSLAIILDRLLLPLGMIWHLEGHLLHIGMKDEVDEGKVLAFSQQSAIRALRQASIFYPDHYPARFVELHTAMIQFHQGGTNESIQNYTAFLNRNPRSRLRQIAWFNLGKAYLLVGNEPAAIDAFYHVIDNGREREISHASYLYVGRLLLELGRYDEATKPLLMAIALSTDPRIRQLSIVALASCYALNDNLSAASSVLVEYDRDLVNEETRGAAELVSQYVRFRAADDSQVDHAGAMLVGSLAHSTDDGFSRVANGLIRSEALRELGLLKQRAIFLEQSILKTPAGAGRYRVLLALSDAHIDLGQLEEAERWLGEVIQNDQEPWNTTARMKQVQIALRNGESERCLKRCAELIGSTKDKDVHKFSLGMMGRIYQSQGEFQKASHCFAGILPPSMPANQLRSSDEQHESVLRN